MNNINITDVAYVNVKFANIVDKLLHNTKQFLITNKSLIDSFEIFYDIDNNTATYSHMSFSIKSEIGLIIFNTDESGNSEITVDTTESQLDIDDMDADVYDVYNEKQTAKIVKNILEVIKDPSFDNIVKTNLPADFSGDIIFP